MKDPKYPNRPEHADFDLLSKVLQGQDAASEGGQPLEDLVPIDLASGVYAARQRALRTIMHFSLPSTMEGPLAALWLDAFAAGHEVGRRRCRGEG